MPKCPIRFLVLICILAISSFALGQENRQLVQNSGEKAKSNNRRVALIIGNGGYTNASRLTNPTNDAQDVALALASMGFDLIGGRAQLNQNADQMKRLIRDFGENLARGGVGLFYYAGHGVQAQGHNYLIPIEASLLREQTLEFDAVDVNRVLAEMDAARNGFNIVILDACRNNPFTRSWRSADQGLAHLVAPEGTLIAYATSPGKIASDGTGRNGTYTGELLREMRVPKISIEQMFKIVRVRVKAITNNQQTPWESSSLVGTFCFLGACDDSIAKDVPATGTASEALPNPVAVELAYWDSIKSSNDIEDFKAYLQKYPNGQFVAIATNRITTLSNEKRISDAGRLTGTDPVELAYWDSIKNSTDPEDFKSYIEKYPTGQFIDLARRRAQARTQPESNSKPTKFLQFHTKVRADNTANGWTNTGIVLHFGQQIRISASGQVSLGNGRFSPAEGIGSLGDPGKLMKTYPTGGLMAVIGDNNDDFIFVGRGRTFPAPHDGVLFLGINEERLTDNSGTFEVAIEVESLAQSSPQDISSPNSAQSTTNPTFFQVTVRVRADNASNGWTNTGLVIRRGQRLRINATGRISLGGNRSATPDGVASIVDRDKLMRNQPTGGLIAVIGDDNDDFVFVGRGRDFVAQRDGVLFLGINEGNLADNSGTFEVVIEAEASGSR